ncbi:endoplasmic reticulum membrane-associated RNA degradation protein-like isoform X2 [Mercenaria mercenaria]|uniref:endoplasmic reticulum membrane-associated RNA degradation protein-like isoform X2 n=1 Tax=Mercenaria mercenaria TaxID=6596 RepID=UPI00234EB2E1|nr:endoplasmic reticulum membrane-associated RNA degradation protein-like isoform X2 [Mercenaria mercenaria]
MGACEITSAMDLLLPCQLKLSKPQTCLSPYVHKLIVEDTYSYERDPYVLDKNRLLDFEYICSKLPDEGSQDDLASYFQGCVTALAPMLHSAEDILGNEKTTLVQKYCPLLDWTGQTDQLLELWEMMKAQDDTDDVTVILVATTILERSLGNVYLLEGPEPCPSMLKDLLVSTHLNNILGCHVIQVLRIVIGPPTSLNIRNVVWHGFPFPGEIPRRCIWFIMLLVPSIGQILKNKKVTGLKCREPVSFPSTALISDTKLFMDEDWPEVIVQTEFVSWKTEYFWKKVKQYYLKQRYGYCAALLLFYLEQGLRHVFATVNKCENRVLTAEATTLYTTFDEILNSSLPDNSENKLCHCISPHIINGPRVRDRLSHGEACWKTFPWQLTENLTMVAVALSARFTPEISSNKVLKGTVSKVLRDISEYTVQFHRIAVLKRNLRKCCVKAAKIDNLVDYTPDLSERVYTTDYPLPSIHDQLIDDLQTVCGVMSDHLSANSALHSVQDCLTYTACTRFSSYIDDLLRSKINTLYREKQCQVPDTQCTDREGEVLSVLEHVTSECHTVLNNLQDFVTLRQQQLLDKQLRSRQRENFKKFLTSFPAFVTITNMCNYMCCWQLYHLDTLNHQNCYNQKIRFWKRSLQFCENLRTCSQPDKNKWTDGLDLISQYTKSLHSNVVTQLMCTHENKT